MKNFSVALTFIYASFGFWLLPCMRKGIKLLSALFKFVLHSVTLSTEKNNDLPGIAF